MRITQPSASQKGLVASLLQVHPRLLIGITVVLSLLLTLYAAVEIHSTRKEFSHLLQEEAQSLLSLTRKGLMDAAVSLEYVEQIVTDRLFDNARYLEKLDYEKRLTSAGLQELSTMNQLFRVNVFDRNGAMELTNFAESGRGGQGGPRQQLQPVLRGETEEMILGYRQGRFGSSQRFAVAKARRRGGAITVTMDAQEMLAFRKSIGAGSFMRYLDSIPDIHYGVLQNREQVILGSRSVSEISAIDSEPFLQAVFADTSIHSRFTRYGQEEILEIAQSLESGSFGRTLLRIGLSTAHMREAEQSARQRVILQSLLFLMIGVVLFHFAFSVQNYRTLQKDYHRIKDQTSSIMTNMNDAVIAIDQHGHVSQFNLAAERVLGVPTPVVLGRPCDQALAAVCPWLLSAWQEKQDRPYLEETLTIRGHRVIVQGSITVLRDEQGRPDTVFAVLRDLTEQKRLQEHITRQDQLNAMGHLASGVAHEIRNPLNAISMIGQRLRLEFKPAREQEEYDLLTTTLVSESRRINDIVQQFLQFSRPAPLNRQPARVDVLVQGWATLLMPACHAKDVQLEVTCSETPAIAIDADKLQQAIWNLAQNSLDACRAGDRITITCGAVQQKIRITIKDTGHGISEQDLPKIFHLYFTTREKGTGLGLAIVQQIIAQHDGVITADSRPGHGTTFIIELG